MAGSVVLIRPLQGKVSASELHRAEFKHETQVKSVFVGTCNVLKSRTQMSLNNKMSGFIKRPEPCTFLFLIFSLISSTGSSEQERKRQTDRRIDR